MAQQAGRARTTRSPVADHASAARSSAVDAGVGRRLRSTLPIPELEAALSPMLEAVVGMAGATAGAVRVVAADGVHLEPGIAVGLPAAMGRSGAGAIAIWCSRCAESRNPDSDCVREPICCGAEDRFSIDLSGPVCRHVVAVPLRYRGAPVGHARPACSSEECALPPADDAAAPRDRRADRRRARERAAHAREPAHEPDRRAADDGERGPRFAGAGPDLHAHADEPAARRDQAGRRAARIQVLERRRRLAHQCACAAARAHHLFSQPDGSAGPAARARRDRRDVFRPHRRRARVRQSRVPSCSCRWDARSRYSTSCRRRSPTSAGTPMRATRRLSLDRTGDGYEIVVEDDGIGMRPVRESASAASRATTASRSCASAPGAGRRAYDRASATGGTRVRASISRRCNRRPRAGHERNHPVSS